MEIKNCKRRLDKKIKQNVRLTQLLLAIIGLDEQRNVIV